MGGGITGAFAAFFAARAGARVTLIERGAIGGGASANSAGGLNPMHGAGIPGPVEALALRSLELHREYRDEIVGRSGIEFGARGVARLHIALDASERDALHALLERYTSADGFSAEWLGRERLRELEPRVRGDALGGLLTRGNDHVDPGPFTRAVAAAAVSLGARIVHAEATGLRSDDSLVTHVETDRGTHPLDGLVLAPGAWSEGPFGWLGLPAMTTPLKGELLLAQTDSGPPAADLSSGPAAVYAAGPDHVVLGGTEEHAGFDADPTPQGRERILSGVAELLPGLGSVRVLEHRSGLRPVSLDGLPIVGIPAGWANACLAGGSGRKGILYGPALGRAAAELLLDGSSALPIEACGPEREMLMSGQPRR